MSRVPSTLDLMSLQSAFRDLWSTVDSISGSNQNLNGRRFQNCGEAQASDEFITLGQANRNFASKSATGASTTVAQSVSGASARVAAFSERGAPSAYRFTTFEASDRNYVGWVSDGVNWVYAYGIQSRTQAQLAAVAATLTTSDAGYLVWVTDFEHVLRWSGSAWTFGPGDAGGGYVAFFTAAPPGNGWVLVDGTATSYLKADGTTQAITPYDVSTMMTPYLRR